MVAANPQAWPTKEYTQTLNNTCFSSYPSGANACDHLWIGDAEAGAPEIDARCSTNMHDPRLLICFNYMQYTRASADSRTPAPLDPEEIRQTWDVLQTSLLGSVRKPMAVFSLGWGTGSLGLVFEAWALWKLQFHAACVVTKINDDKYGCHSGKVECLSSSFCSILNGW